MFSSIYRTKSRMQSEHMELVFEVAHEEQYLHSGLLCIFLERFFAQKKRRLHFLVLVLHMCSVGRSDQKGCGSQDMPMSRELILNYIQLTQAWHLCIVLRVFELMF